MPDLSSAGTARNAALLSLAVDSTTADVAERLKRGGIRTVLLKGPSIARWLYEPGGSRDYRDVDLLLAAPQLALAGQLLSRAGFRRALDGTARIEAHTVHDAWTSPLGVLVELHHSFFGIEASDLDTWREFSSSTVELEVAGQLIEAPSIAGRCLLVSLHAAQHGKDVATPLEDLRRACERVYHATWSQAAAIARTLNAAEAMSAGLRLVSSGRTIAADLGLPATASTALLLRTQTAPSHVLTLEGITEQVGFVPRLSYVARKLFPTRAFMRYRYGLSGRSPARVALAYPLRWMNFLAASGPNIRLWRRLRRQSRR